MMGLRLETVTIRMPVGREPEVSFTVMPSGANTHPVGQAIIPQCLIDQLKQAAQGIKNSIDTTAT